MKRSLKTSILIIAVMGAMFVGCIGPGDSSIEVLDGSPTNLHGTDLALSFEPNVGQTDPSVSFLARAKNYRVYLTSKEAVLTFGHGDMAEVIRMEIAGGRPDARLTGADLLPGKTNYFIGSDPAGWLRNVDQYARVVVSDVYPGVDLVYRGSARQLEYDFVVGPEVDTNQIGIVFKGTSSVTETPEGHVVVRMNHGELCKLKPVVYQVIDGARRAIAASSRVQSTGRVHFELAEYDRTRPLVIDPVIVYSTYLGGSGEDVANAIEVDHRGNAFVTGRANSNDFPTTEEAFQQIHAGGRDIFVSKLRSNGRSLAYSTFIGGTLDENPIALTINDDGEAYITGPTASQNFPLVSPFQPAYAGGGFDTFVARLSEDGDELLYSTYLGGNGLEQGRGIALDEDGQFYVTGNTNSTNWPVQNAFQPVKSGGDDAYITKFTADGSALIFSTYLGGAALDNGRAIRVDAVQDVFVAGETRSVDFPTTVGVFQETYGGGQNDVFVTKMNASGSSLDYSTFLGGSGSDQSAIFLGTSISWHGRPLAIDEEGDAYVTGDTASPNFPMVNALQPAYAGGATDAFLTRINADATAIVYSSYLGGYDYETARGIDVARPGRVYLAGTTKSANFPTQDALQAYGGGVSDGFVTIMDAEADGGAMIFGTHLGGSSDDQAWGVRVRPDGRRTFYVVGDTSSADFPTGRGSGRGGGRGQDPVQPEFGGVRDGYVIKLR